MIITDFTDNDLYTFTQGQFAFHRYRDVPVKFKFKCRTPGFDFAPFFDRIQMEVDALHGLKFTDNNLSSLARLDLFKDDYLEFLKTNRLRPDREVKLDLNKDGSLDFEMEGLWPTAIHYETHVLGIVSEVCQMDRQEQMGAAWMNLMRKMRLLSERERKIILFEMGTRRRQSKYWQEQVIQNLNTQKLLAGTSNVMFGTQFGIPIIGTVAHQAFQVAQAMAPQLEGFIQFFLKQWMEEYPNGCKTTLTDIVGYKAFIKAMTREFALHYNGFRQDSGDPIVMGEAFIQMLFEFHLEAKSRILVFSDGLDINQQMFDLHDHFIDRIGVNIAIGTGLTNDFTPFFKALSMVVKMITCDGKPVAKISDDKGKGMCEDAAYATKLAKMYGME